MDNKLNYILVNGYGWSGSSALIDFFREFNNTYVPNKEFRLIKDPFGLIDLDNSICNSIDQLNEDIAIRNFKWLADKYINKAGGFRNNGLSYCVDFGKNIAKITSSYIEALTDYNYRSYWWFLEFKDSYIKYIIKKILRRLGIYNSKNHYKMRLVLKTEEEFVQLTKAYLNDIFMDLISDDENNIHHVVLDQAIPANNPDLVDRYFNNGKVIVVDRDPRDVYIDLINEKSLVGYDVALNHNVDLFVSFYKKVRHQREISTPNFLKIKFEELVLQYDKTINEILRFLGIDSSAHINKFKYFDPNKSKKNIAIWANYPYQSEIRQIEEELPEYCINNKFLGL